MTRPNLTLLFEPRPFRTIFSTCGRTVRLIYVQVIVSILLLLCFSSTKGSLNWKLWKAVLFYEKLSTNVSESDKDGWYFINSGTLENLTLLTSQKTRTSSIEAKPSNLSNLSLVVTYLNE